MRPIDALFTLTWRRLLFLEETGDPSSVQTNNSLIVNGSFFVFFQKILLF